MYLVAALWTLNFGNSFIRWVEVLQEDIATCIRNNDFTSDIFPVGQGVCQGVPLFPTCICSLLVWII